MLLTAAAKAGDQPLADLSLEELANLEITSVSRHAERLSDAAASIYVITADAIRRSGATTLPQALRLAPNLQVAQVNASQYAISARGFNNAIGNKLLVLIDGRTVYTPFYSGVFWDQQDVMLQDIERIEVISGPGGTLWGSNAVNGVINIITKAAGDTQGALAEAGGSASEGQVAARYGGSVDGKGSFRIYGKRTRLDDTTTPSGASANDGWDFQQAGFRTDWAQAQDQFTVQGDLYAGKTLNPQAYAALGLGPLQARGNNLLARWTRQLADGSDLSLQSYYDHTDRDDPLLYHPKEDIFDIEFQSNLLFGAHKLVWGGGYRHADDDIAPGLFFGIHPEDSSLSWLNVFAQDEFQLSAALVLSLGAKLEHNDFTGTEKLPSARLAWKLDTNDLLWADISRAVRAPSLLDRDISLPPKPPYLIAGGPDFVSEVATVYELGWRAQPSATLSYSATVYYNQWSRLRSGQTPPNAEVQNMIDGNTYGAEGWLNWQVLPAWRLTAGTTWLAKNLHVEAGSTDPTGPSALGNDPQQQWMLRSSFDLSTTQEIDLDARRISALPNPAVPAYTALDLHYGWQLSKKVNVSLLGQNLIGGGHAEFNAVSSRSDIPRRLFLQLTWTPF